jgi:hypothetical protein
MSPVPPMTTIFMLRPYSCARSGRYNLQSVCQGRRQESLLGSAGRGERDPARAGSLRAPGAPSVVRADPLAARSGNGQAPGEPARGQGRVGIDVADRPRRLGRRPAKRSRYPSSTGRLRERIVGTGAADVTEYLHSERDDTRRFVERNRLQAGLAAQNGSHSDWSYDPPWRTHRDGQFASGIVSSVSSVSTTNTARSLAGCVSLALALIAWRSPGSSDQLRPAS